MHTHIPRFETIGMQTWHRCSKCPFIAVMSWEPEYAAVVVTPGDPDVQHIAHGQVFLPDGSLTASTNGIGNWSKISVERS